MSKVRERILNAGFNSKWGGIFRCPICFSEMKIRESKSLICTNNHCFDLAKSGYVNFLSRPHQSKYTKKLFESRRAIFRQGLFNSLLSSISRWIIQDFKGDCCKLLDSGCGEGTNLSYISDLVERETAAEILGVGLDISKEGIYMASKEFPHQIWCVADLAKTPFAGKTFNYIVNILSPANYAEFKRLLTKDGVLIKVIPEKGYMRELREILYEDSDKQEYQNSGTEKFFQENMVMLDSQRVQYSVTLEGSSISDLVNMSPLCWGATEQCLQKVLKRDSIELTVDLKVLYGKPMFNEL